MKSLGIIRNWIFLLDGTNKYLNNSYRKNFKLVSLNQSKYLTNQFVYLYLYKIKKIQYLSYL